MNNLERLFRESGDAAAFADGYLNYLSGLLKRLDRKAVAAFVEELERAREEQATVFIVGNGGSAATASHMANDFGVGTRAAVGGRPFRVLALTDNVATMTAIGNDEGYEHLFVSQLRIHYRQGDRLVAISASGNSPNVVAAAEWVKGQGGRVIGLTGFDGGTLKPLCDIAIHAETPKGEYGPVEDVHMILDHLIYTWLKSRVR
jgi:D-sedoheptulose 7-phosphate isomerase